MTPTNPIHQPTPGRTPFKPPTAGGNLLKGLAITWVVNSAIALALWLAGTGPLDEHMVYSQGIGLTIWALMNAGARWLARPGDPGNFPRGWRAALLVPTVVVLGAVLGNLMGNVYAGHSFLVFLKASPRMAAMMLAITAVVSGALTLYFFLSGKSSYLQAELERTQRLAAEAQLALLQSQLEPHMLFNTLANLRVLIALDADKAQAMLDHLIAYLRATLSASRNTQRLHPLSAEFDRLRDYLALMSVRMGPRLGYTLELPHHLGKLPMPPLLLQPLVENAIRHGLEPQVAGGHITVRASQQGQQLLLEVTDTGVGLSPQATAQPMNASGVGMGGFGLAQVRERLATAYGTDGVFELIANKPNGTSARVLFNI